MLKEKMVLKVHKAEPITGGIVRIDKEALEIVQRLQRDTGLSARKIISECIKFGSQNYEVLEV